jgi:hypothetical protein
MTIQELYEWACSKCVANCGLVIRDLDGNQTHYITPEIVPHVYPNGKEYIEIEL